jgi:hypothetical protein
MKPDLDMDDAAFKEDALRHLDVHGRPVLFVDNEPVNVNVFRRERPDATVVWIETDHSDRPDEPGPGVERLRSFLRTGDAGR